jgi:urease subunit gamma/beta
VQLTPSERDRLLLFTAAELARARRARGLRLNLPEATALVADAVCEAARDGRRHSEALAAGRAVLGPGDVLPGVADILTEVSVEALFDDGTRLVVVPDPIGGGHLGESAPGAVTSTRPEPAAAEGAVEVTVTNGAAVPVSVTSHFHFFEVNPRLSFDRAAAYGRHLDVDAGSSVAFPPGQPVRVRLVPIAGDRVAIGFAGLVDGPLDAPGARERALELLRECGFADTGDPEQRAAADPDGAAAAVRQHLAAHPEVQR